MTPTLHAAAEAIRQGRGTPVDLVEQCLERIDQDEERVRAWVFVDRDGARAEALRLTDELRRGQRRGPLHGIPLGVKDIFDVFDWPTAAGSRLWAQSIARQDAVVVRRLRQAGAIFLGKTVTTQYASFDPPSTRNPWHAERTPGGSSSGSAAAVACGMCFGALASQTGGSITRPASFCGVVGCKPSYGRLPLDGIVPLAESMDHPGAMTRSVRDVAILLQAMGGVETQADTGIESNPAGLVLGRLRGLFEDLAEPVVLACMERVVAQLKAAGVTVKDIVLPAAFGEVLERHRIVMAVEAAKFHEVRLRRHPDDYGPNITALVQEGLGVSAPEYARTKEHQRELTEALRRYRTEVSAFLAPATRGPAPDAATTGDPAFNSPWSYTGLPLVSFPVERTPEGLPLAIQLIGSAWLEELLFPVALTCEKILGFEIGAPEAHR